MFPDSDSPPTDAFYFFAKFEQFLVGACCRVYFYELMAIRGGFSGLVGERMPIAHETRLGQPQPHSRVLGVHLGDLVETLERLNGLFIKQ